MKASSVMAAALFALGLAACGDKDDDDTADEGGDDTASTGDDTGSTGDDTGSLTEDCSAVEFTDGDSGTYTVAAGDDHVKHHIKMPEGIHKVIATTTWDETDWEMTLSIGTGTCPHSGEELASASGTGGSVTIELSASELDGAPETFDANDTWFSHLGMDDGGELGDTSGYAMEIQACTYVR